ncbi:uncharacterized protein N7515_005506 [Penicillium bovifimosum]|uniref:Tail sheath protein C-terminal domain-containing protein n=1 Tax=Penicillium bovifimosum TaxID=126998 RepID=A0A9W9L094_9EURO|nr:uncharacterized protein N7515_005506 [Penicillium bovifimosum]KAJ5129467.1 hypothetical protein N7515_005506 [Penicillium bovifimosum]
MEVSLIILRLLMLQFTILGFLQTGQKLPSLPGASAAMAGLYCKVDKRFDVWKTPTSPLEGGLRPLRSITNELQTSYPGINMIRSFQGRGLIPSSAQTLATNLGDFRSISVRRFADQVEREVETFLITLKDEQNGPATWEAARAAINEYLYHIWQRGGLYGETPQQAYYVRLGPGSTMTSEDIDQGLMQVTIGLAIIRTVEFLHFDFSSQLQV